MLSPSGPETERYSDHLVSATSRPLGYDLVTSDLVMHTTSHIAPRTQRIANDVSLAVSTGSMDNVYHDQTMVPHRSKVVRAASGAARKAFHLGS